MSCRKGDGPDQYVYMRSQCARHSAEQGRLIKYRRHDDACWLDVLTLDVLQADWSDTSDVEPLIPGTPRAAGSRHQIGQAAMNPATISPEMFRN